MFFFFPWHSTLSFPYMMLLGRIQNPRTKNSYVVVMALSTQECVPVLRTVHASRCGSPVSKHFISAGADSVEREFVPTYSTVVRTLLSNERTSFCMYLPGNVTFRRHWCI